MRPLAALFFLVISLPSALAATFETGKIAGWPAIRISGPIVIGDDKTFQGLIPSDQKKMIVELNSGGGAVFPAIAIGRLIHDRGDWTLVAKRETCASACAMIWLAGATRYAHPNGSIGFHAVFDGNTKEITSNGNAVVGAYYDHLGMSQDAIFWMASAPPNGMFWINHDIEKRYNIPFAVAKDDDHIVDPVVASSSGGIPLNPNAPAVAVVPPPKIDADGHPDIVLNFVQEQATFRLARQIKKRFAEAGQGGLIQSIEACYGSVHQTRDTNAAVYCGALDAMSWKLDVRLAQERGVQPSRFNSQEKVRGRVQALAVDLGSDPKEVLDTAVEMAKQAQVIVDADSIAPENAPPQVVYRRPRIARPRLRSGCGPIGLAALNPAGAMLFGTTPNPACQ